LCFDDPPAYGGWNMAADEALAEYSAEHGVAVSRFYEWAEPTLSLGYFQAAANRRGHTPSLRCALVRRPSGGGAILHDRELTYCLSIPASHPAASDAGWLYRATHEALATALSSFGVAASLRLNSECDQPATSAGPSPEPFLCFQRRAAGDLLIGGEKIAGSAQRRRRGAVMQHGSVLLAASPFATELSGVAELTGQAIEPKSLARLFQAALGDRLNMKCVDSGLSDSIAERAKELERSKFASPEWTFRR